MSRYTKSRKKFTGCDEDCFNCKYRDCLKLASQIRRDDNISAARQSTTKSSAPTYSVAIKLNF